MIGELDAAAPWSDKTSEICYVGAIAEIRGVPEMVGVMDLLKSGARLNLVGHCAEHSAEAGVKATIGWGRVKEWGRLDRDGVKEVLGRSMAGLVLLHPIPDYLDALPIKMFEYMSPDIPVIVSDFPHWRGIIGESNCGICVDPLDCAAAAKAIDELITNPEPCPEDG